MPFNSLSMDQKCLRNYWQARPLAENKGHFLFLLCISCHNPFKPCFVIQRAIQRAQKQLDDSNKMAYQFWKELCDKGICIFSSVAVYNYRQAKQKEDDRKDNQREQLIERSAGEGAECPGCPGAEIHAFWIMCSFIMPQNKQIERRIKIKLLLILTEGLQFRVSFRFCYPVR